MIARALAALGLVALVVAGFLLLLNRQQGVPAQTQPSTPGQSQPGYAARDAVIVETGADGEPMYTLRADTVHQVPAQQLVTLTHVRLAFHDTGGDTWTAHAARGRILQNAASIDLDGAVVVTGQLPGQAQPARITTEQLSVDTQARTVRTRLPVTLEWAGRQLHARGLFASLKDQRVKLESDVHGTFTP